MKKILALILAIAFMFCGGYAYAGEATSQSTITINYTGGCEISSNNVELNYVQGSDTTGWLGVNITCSAGLDWTLIVDGGLNQEGAFRRAKQGDDYIKYRFFKDSGYTQEIETPPSNTIATGTGNSSLELFNVYVRVNAEDNNYIPGPRIGTYTDTVTFAVYF